VCPSYEKLERPLGEGTFGIVYKARDLTSGELVAMKRLPMGVWNEGMPATALREISLLKELGPHPNIAELLDVFVSYNGNLYLVFELMDCDLKSVMDSAKLYGMPKHWAKHLLWQLLRAIEQCHSHRVCHRDVKPQNILFRKPTGELKLADFGLARTQAYPARRYTHEVITMWYRCPEILLGQEAYTNAVDIWSVGCIMAEMSAGEPVFQGQNEWDQLRRVRGAPTKSSPRPSPELPSLLPVSNAPIPP